MLRRRREDQSLVFDGALTQLRLQRVGELPHQRLHVVLVPAQLLAHAALVEVRQFGHLRGGEVVDLAFAAAKLDGIILHLHVQMFENAALLPRLHASKPGAGR